MGRFDNPLVPTINEIEYNRQSKRRSDRMWFDTRFHFNVGDIVRFMFNGLPRIGRISNFDLTNSRLPYYHIESETGTWYRHIYEGNIQKQII